jgi:hypothetical protein
MPTQTTEPTGVPADDRRTGEHDGDGVDMIGADRADRREREDGG